MRPNRFLGRCIIIICVFKIQACSLVTGIDSSELHVAMETVQAYMKVAKFANKGQFERYTERNLTKLHPYLS